MWMIRRRLRQRKRTNRRHRIGLVRLLSRDRSTARSTSPLSNGPSECLCVVGSSTHRSFPRTRHHLIRSAGEALGAAPPRTCSSGTTHHLPGVPLPISGTLSLSPAVDHDNVCRCATLSYSLPAKSAARRVRCLRKFCPHHLLRSSIIRVT